ncbi:MAG: phage integrase N-terminal SAM-like domain-containing protein, partial [Nostoc sp.]
MTVNNPELNNLPPIKLIPLNAETASLLGRTTSTRPPTDIRWVKILEFLRSNNLAPNSRKLYERELKRFLAWSELHYHELRPRHLALYKEYLRDEIRTDVGKPLSKSSINAGIAALKSFFKWMC